MIYTTEEVSKKLSLAPVTVRLRARKLKIGRKLHARALVFTPEEVEMIDQYADKRYRRNW